MRDPLLKSTPSLSITFPTYNEQHLAASGLDRLRSLGEFPDLDRAEVIVIDDGPSDGVAAALDEVAT